MWQVSARRRSAENKNNTTGGEHDAAPDGAPFAGPVPSGHGFLWPVSARAHARCRGCCPPSDPSRQARSAAFRVPAELTGLPVSAVGLDDPACRGAEGGHLQYQSASGHCIKLTETGGNEVKPELNTVFLHISCGFLKFPAPLTKYSARPALRIEPADGPPQRRSRCSSQLLPCPSAFRASLPR